MFDEHWIPQSFCTVDDFCCKTFWGDHLPDPLPKKDDELSEDKNYTKECYKVVRSSLPGGVGRQLHRSTL